MNLILKLAFGIAVVLSVASCSSSKEKPALPIVVDTEIFLEIKAKDNINPDDNNIPSPLFVRLYELKSEKTFMKANFLDLYEKDKKILGEDMLAKHELKHLIPGENSINNYTLEKDSQYVGLYAEFVQYQNSGYKLIVPVVKSVDGKMSVVISVSGNNIEIYQPTQ